MKKTHRKRTSAPAQEAGALYTYQQEGSYFAQIAEGLEPLAKQELSRLGAKAIQAGFRGLYFHASREVLYRVNYQSRFIQKIIAPLQFLDCHSTKYLYNRAKAIDWTDFLSLEKTFAIVSNVSNSHIRHSKYAALRLMDAIADFFTELVGKRPSVDTKEPDVWLNLYINNNRAVIGLEVSGGSLHKRGYRLMGHEAPIQETVAAAMLELAEWDGERPLYDPMCGSGTLLCEAVMRYCRIPAGFLRTQFGFESLPDFDAEVWKAVKAEADSYIRPLPEDLIAGSDISVKALEAAAANLGQLAQGTDVKLKAIDFRDIKALENTTIISNPPHGLRLQKKEGMEVFCKDLGDFLKQRCQGSTAYLFFGAREWIKHIGLRTTWKKPLASGGLDGRLIKLEIF